MNTQLSLTIHLKYLHKPQATCTMYTHIPSALLPSRPALPNIWTNSSTELGQPILMTRSIFATSTPMPNADVHTMTWMLVVHCFDLVMTGHVFAMVAAASNTLLPQGNCNRGNIPHKVEVNDCSLLSYQLYHMFCCMCVVCSSSCGQEQSTCMTFMVNNIRQTNTSTHTQCSSSQ